jgi:hypothetical protein
MPSVGRWIESSNRPDAKTESHRQTRSSRPRGLDPASYPPEFHLQDSRSWVKIAEARERLSLRLRSRRMLMRSVRASDGGAIRHHKSLWCARRAGLDRWQCIPLTRFPRAGMNRRPHGHSLSSPNWILSKIATLANGLRPETDLHGLRERPVRRRSGTKRIVARSS